MDPATVFVLCLTGGLLGFVIYLAKLSSRGTRPDHASSTERESPGSKKDAA